MDRDFVPIRYRCKRCGIDRLDFVVEGKVIVELKAAKQFEDIHHAMVLSYLKACCLPVALLLNFAEPTLAIRRFGDRFFLNGKPGSQENGKNWLDLINATREVFDQFKMSTGLN